MSRIKMPDPSNMSPDQIAACEEVTAGPRGKVPAPMIAWIQNPELATRAQHLGALLRYKTSLNARLTELAILVCARHWTAHFEWKAHKKMALDAGLHPDIIAAIAERRPPPFNDALERLVHEISTELLQTGRVSKASYARGLETLGERGMVELVAILGYYCMVSLTLNTFELGLPEGVAPELNDPQYAEAIQQNEPSAHA